MQESTCPKIAVIGGSGFIGQALVRELRAKGYAVRILDIAAPAILSNAEYHKADVRDPDALRDSLQGCDVVINLAAAHRDDVRPVSLYREVNVDGAACVCQVAEELGIEKLVFTSSVAIYGLQDGIPDEDTPAKPFNPYGQTKWEAEQVYRDWQTRAPQRRTLLIVRPTVVFGPGNRGNVYTLVAQLASGHFVMVGDGENRKSMAYVRNVVAFLAHITERKTAQAGSFVYNYVDKDDFSMDSLLLFVRQSLGQSTRNSLRLPYALGIAAAATADAVARISGRTFAISRVRVQKFCANTVFSAERLNETGFVPPFRLEDGLREMIRSEFPHLAKIR